MESSRERLDTSLIAATPQGTLRVYGGSIGRVSAVKEVSDHTRPTHELNADSAARVEDQATLPEYPATRPGDLGAGGEAT
eukprot:scaffold135147_cov28-Tisochrysis_lutea.AAC.2